MNLKKFFFSDILIVLIIFLLDRISKLYVIHLDGTLLNSEIITSKFINIQLIWNEGVAFGLFAFDDKFFIIKQFKNNAKLSLSWILVSAVYIFVVHTFCNG